MDTSPYWIDDLIADLERLRAMHGGHLRAEVNGWGITDLSVSEGVLLFETGEADYLDSEMCELQERVDALESEVGELEAELCEYRDEE